MEPVQGGQAPERASVASPERPGLTRKPSLLPAFEPFSSSPLPRPRSEKRKYEGESPLQRKEGLKFYPTPVPTSSTGILPSSPSARPARPGLQRTISTMSQRSALAAVPVIELPQTGEPIRMGRSGNSSDYQLSTSRLISRVHIETAYHPPSASHAYGEVVITCLGWNGATVHSRGQMHELAKGDTFASDIPSAEIMLDVQDARVLLAFPSCLRKESVSVHSDSIWNDESPSRRVSASPRQIFASSPPPVIPESPVSPTPGAQLIDPSASATFIELGNDFPNAGGVQVYEDGDSDDVPKPSIEEVKPEPLSSRSSSTDDFQKVLENSENAEIASFPSDDFSDHNEENDPIIHSFGPFGDNILPRLASFNTQRTPQPGPARARRPLKSPTHSPQQPSSSKSSARFNESPIKNHVINQLAYSRLHSIPISSILGNLPVDLKTSASISQSGDGLDSLPGSIKQERLTVSGLKVILDSIPCVGEIKRQGKDAAGKALEDEFYYVPEMDSDLLRREAVTGGRGGTGLRAVRRNHKVGSSASVKLGLESFVLIVAAILLEKAPPLGELAFMSVKSRRKVYTPSLVHFHDPQTC
jgi:hypothetical protein